MVPVSILLVHWLLPPTWFYDSYRGNTPIIVLVDWIIIGAGGYVPFLWGMYAYHKNDKWLVVLSSITAATFLSIVLPLLSRSAQTYMGLEVVFPMTWLLFLLLASFGWGLMYLLSLMETT